MNSISRMMVSLAVLAVVMFALSGVGGVTESRSGVGGMDKITLTWTANGGTSDYVRGYVERAIVTVAVCTQTTASVTLKDENGIDLLAGKASAVATNTATSFYAGLARSDSGVTNVAPFAVNDKLTIAVPDGATNSTGTIILYVRP